MVETIRTREVELLNELRNGMTDPSSRGTSQADTFSGNAVLTTFTLTVVAVKYLSSVVVDGSTKYIGYDYSISLGEGTASSTITFNTAPANDTNNIVVTYRYGATMIYEGFQRLDSALPRVSVMFKSAVPDFVSIGEDGDSTSGGKQIWYNVTYTAEIRSRFAKQMKTVMNNFANLINSLRQSTPQLYKTFIIMLVSIIPYDFDNELRLYRAQVTYQVRWLVKYKD